MKLDGTFNCELEDCDLGILGTHTLELEYEWEPEEDASFESTGRDAYTTLTSVKIKGADFELIDILSDADYKEIETTMIDWLEG